MTREELESLTLEQLRKYKKYHKELESYNLEYSYLLEALDCEDPVEAIKTDMIWIDLKEKGYFDNFTVVERIRITYWNFDDFTRFKTLIDKYNYNYIDAYEHIMNQDSIELTEKEWIEKKEIIESIEKESNQNE